jgi:hypothetical protein
LGKTGYSRCRWSNMPAGIVCETLHHPAPLRQRHVRPGQLDGGWGVRGAARPRCGAGLGTPAPSVLARAASGSHMTHRRRFPRRAHAAKHRSTPSFVLLVVGDDYAIDLRVKMICLLSRPTTQCGITDSGPMCRPAGPGGPGSAGSLRMPSPGAPGPVGRPAKSTNQ